MTNSTENVSNIPKPGDSVSSSSPVGSPACSVAGADVVTPVSAAVWVEPSIMGWQTEQSNPVLDVLRPTWLYP